MSCYSCSLGLGKEPNLQPPAPICGVGRDAAPSTHLAMGAGNSARKISALVCNCWEKEVGNWRAQSVERGGLSRKWVLITVRQPPLPKGMDQSRRCSSNPMQEHRWIHGMAAGSANPVSLGGGTAAPHAWGGYGEPSNPGSMGMEQPSKRKSIGFAKKMMG